MDLTEAQWAKLKPLLAPKRRSDGRGRLWRDTRAVLSGVLWVLRTGAPWHDLPDRYPPGLLVRGRVEVQPQRRLLGLLVWPGKPRLMRICYPYRFHLRVSLPPRSALNSSSPPWIASVSLPFVFPPKNSQIDAS